MDAFLDNMIVNIEDLLQNSLEVKFLTRAWRQRGPVYTISPGARERNFCWLEKKVTQFDLVLTYITFLDYLVCYIRQKQHPCLE